MKAEVVQEEALSAVEAGKRVRDFLKRRQVQQLLPAETYSSLQGLQEALLEKEKKKKTSNKKKQQSRAESESESADVSEPDRKKRRQCSDVT